MTSFEQHINGPDPDEFAAQGMDKEQVYDTYIYPLVDQVIKLCRKHKIASLMDFRIPTEKDPLLVVTSMTPAEDGNENGHHVALVAMGYNLKELAKSSQQDKGPLQ